MLEVRNAIAGILDGMSVEKMRKIGGTAAVAKVARSRRPRKSKVEGLEELPPDLQFPSAHNSILIQ